MDFKGQKSPREEAEKRRGGLLANVSLLTTGGSSLQHYSNNGLQTTVDKKDTLSGKRAADKVSSSKNLSTKNDPILSTSTPARSEFGNVVYGFDLSPVHSYEIPATQTSPIKNEESRSQDDIELQNKLEEQLFSDNLSAPNFMQAPSVSSSHQSKLSVRQSDDTETMMSQVYSQQGTITPSKTRSGSAKKKMRLTKSATRSPSHVSPRKSSKLYSHVQGSGYGMVSPWKSPIKPKPEQKKKPTVTAPKKKSKPKQDASEFLRDSALALLANVREQKEQKTNNKTYSQFEKTGGHTYKIKPKDDFPKEAKFEKRQDPLPQPPINVKQSAEFLSLKDRFMALEDECSKLKAGKEEVNKENFLLTAKLNKLVKMNESGDPMIKDSLNDDSEVGRLKKEIMEQDKLLNGYQQENEKLYNEVSKLKILQRENENAMFDENLKLKNKMAALKEELETKDAVIKDKKQLLLDKSQPKTRVISISVQTEDFSDLTTSKQNLVKDKEILALKMEVEQLNERQSSTFDKDKRLMKANQDIITLQQEVNRLKRDLSIKITNSKKKESEKVEELQLQVKQLEKSLVKAQSSDHVKDVLYGDKERVLLEERCQQLETRLKTQEEQFSNNMSSLHQLYKNMTKDYEGRVETLSIQLDHVKKAQSRPAVIREGCSMEQFNLLRDENTLLQSQMEDLKKELVIERKASKNSPGKTKKKNQAKNESIYRPDFFAQNPPQKVAPLTAPPTLETTNQVRDLTAEKEILSKEIAQWKTMYSELKTTHDHLKENELSQMSVAHNKAITELRNNCQQLQDKLMIVQMDLTKSTSDLSSSASRERALQLQVRTLVEELQETRRASPVAAFRHLDSLQAQVRMLNFRQKSREDKLDKVVSESADEYTKAEIRSLHNTISEKNLLISKFQYELDSILSVLESLQKSKQIV